MFSIAAINDSDSKGEWQPLAPTKEAQEFHLSQIYHEGLVKLQSKEYEKARELLESVLRDPLISSAKVESSTSDGHLLQLRFLALKNLASVFLQQGPAHHESALRCYLQAVDIDNKDAVVWNQLGTLACSMGSLSISRWAFEQGLVCSPNNWNCMEKLMEVLIAIGDEVSCLSVAQLILRQWPSHARALHVKNTIEDPKVVPFAPKGIDKLEPKHARLKFLDKRKLAEANIDDERTSKKLNNTMELQLTAASWTVLADELLKILLPISESGSGSGDTKLIVHLPSGSESMIESGERKGSIASSQGDSLSADDFNSEKAGLYKGKDASTNEEQHQERRSSRLERRKKGKPDKEEMEFSNEKDLSKVVVQFLEPFIVGGAAAQDCHSSVNCSAHCHNTASNLVSNESDDVTRFVRASSKNYGAYHMAHLLLEEVASSNIAYQDTFAKLLDLEKLTRHWAKDRSPKCSLFLAELYHDFGLRSSDTTKLSDFMSETCYHICKIIEFVASEHPFNLNSILGDGNKSSSGCSPHNSGSGSSNLPLANDLNFWVRFFWLSGRLSIFEGNKEKAQQELCVSLSILEKVIINNSVESVCLSHCKVVKDLTENRILQEINLLEVNFLLKKEVGEMIEKEMYVECIGVLAPLLFSTMDSQADNSCFSDYKSEEIASVELSALDVLIKACEKAKSLDCEVSLKCHRRRLQILLVAAGMGERLPVNAVDMVTEAVAASACGTDATETPCKQWNPSVEEEVKAISKCTSLVKHFIDSSRDSNGFIALARVVGDIQSLLLVLMCNIANTYFSKKSAETASLDQNEQRQTGCFVDAAILFCKLHQLNPGVPIKTHIELLVAMHDLLAEYGLCCAAGHGEVQEGAFLKFAIKHLLSLDMKLKSNISSLNKDSESMQCDEQVSKDNHDKTRPDKLKGDLVNVLPDIDGSSSLEKDVLEAARSKCRRYGDDRTNGVLHKGESSCSQASEFDNQLTEDEKEELELAIDNSLDQCFFCLYGLNLRSDSSYEDDIALHKNTSRADYQSKEQCADVFHYILPYAKASSKTGLTKLRRVLRAIRKHFPQPPDSILTGNPIDKFLDDPDLCEDKLSEEAGSEGFQESITSIIFPGGGSLEQIKTSSSGIDDPYLEVYRNLYYLLAQSEEMNATDKWAGFVFTKEGEEFVDQNAKLFKYDLLYNPLRFESWERLANIYDEEVDLLLNDGSKQINATSWRKNPACQRVEKSRRRSRRCLLVTSALAKTSDQQGEIHELLALVYYDGLQNVVPFYDQRSVVPLKDAAWKMYCQNSMRHFKKAFAHKEDWSYTFYLGKLSEKLGFSHDISLSYYHQAINLNPTAVDAVYRMHASRLKLLCTCGKQNRDALKLVAEYSYCQLTKETIIPMLNGTPEALKNPVGVENAHQVDSHQWDEAWDMLYRDCLSALETCVEGDLKHFHKARYMLAQGYYRRGDSGDLEKAKDELSFCFKSSRSSFTINMWEIDSMVKKGRRRTAGPSGNKKTLEVHLPESSRKFITCIRKYFMLYCKLLEDTGDICTLERAYITIRADKRFSLCLEDLVPVALGRLVKGLVSSMPHDKNLSSSAVSNSEHVLEKIFSLFLEQMNLWSDICNLPEISCQELSESSLYRYLLQYIQLLESSARVEVLEGVSEKIRKRFKNPKFSNGGYAKVYKHVTFAWFRSVVISLALISPLNSGTSSEIQVSNPSDTSLEFSQLLGVDVQTSDLWDSSLVDPDHLKVLETNWNPSLSKVRNLIIKKASEQDLETAATLLRCSYNLYRDPSSAMLVSGISLYTVPSQLASEGHFNRDMAGVNALDLNIPRKLLVWAYTLLHGHYTNFSAVTKYCEENAKSKMRKGPGSATTPLNTPVLTATTSHTGGDKDGTSKHISEAEATPVVSAALPQDGNLENLIVPDSEDLNYCEENAKGKMRKGPGSATTPLNTPVPTATASDAGGDKDGPSKHMSEAEVSAALAQGDNLEDLIVPDSEDPELDMHCDDTTERRSNLNLNDDDEAEDDTNNNV